MNTDLIELLSKPQKSSEKKILKALASYPDIDPRIVPMTKELFDKQTELNTYCCYNKNALYHAIESGYSDNVIRVLLRKGALPYIAATHASDMNDMAMFQKIYEKTEQIHEKTEQIHEKTEQKVEPIDLKSKKISQIVKKNVYEGCMLNFTQEPHNNYSKKCLKTYLTLHMELTKDIENMYLLNRCYNAKNYYRNQLKNKPRFYLGTEELIEIYKGSYYVFFCDYKERFEAAINQIGDSTDWNLEKRLTQYKLYKEPTEDDRKRVAKLVVESELKILEELKNSHKAAEVTAAKGLFNFYKKGLTNTTNTTNATNTTNKRFKKN